jgi:hypothetical protein
MKIKSLNKLSALIGVICGLILLPLTTQAQPYPYEWVNTGTGDWSEAVNWDNGVPALVPGNDIYISNGGRAEITWLTYVDLGNADPIADSVTLTNGSTLYMDSYLEGVKKLTLSGGSKLIMTDYGGINTLTPKGGEIALYENSSINVSVPFYYSELNVNKVTGDGTGTFNITGNASHFYGIELNNINIHSAAAGYINVETFSGTGNLTVASGTFDVNNDNRTGGNITVAAGAKLVSSSVTTEVHDGYSLSGDGTIEFRGSNIRIMSGGRLDSSLTFTSNNYFTSDQLILENGVILTYVEDSPLTFLGWTGDYKNFELVVGNSVFVDFSNTSLVADNDYIIIDWSGAPNMIEIDFSGDNFATDIAGTFNVVNNQLVFHATAVPEPSVYILLGIGLGILLITAHRRRRVQS